MEQDKWIKKINYMMQFADEKILQRTYMILCAMIQAKEGVK